MKNSVLFNRLLVILSVMIITKGCKKNETQYSDLSNIEERFFSKFRTYDSIETRLIDYFIKKNKNENFIKPLTKKIGFPRWDKVFSMKKEQNSNNITNDTLSNVYYIPFVLDFQNCVNATLCIETIQPNRLFTTGNIPKLAIIML